jgi:hypothetical protein
MDATKTRNHERDVISTGAKPHLSLRPTRTAPSLSFRPTRTAPSLSFRPRSVARSGGISQHPERPFDSLRSLRVTAAFLSILFARRLRLLTLSFPLLTLSFATAGQWRGVYHDAPIAVHITPNRDTFAVGDTFRLDITATNTSDRDVLLRRNWREQLVLYHLLLTSTSTSALASQVEWPGQACVATWVDSSDVVVLKPGESYTRNRYIRVWIPEDAATFEFRVKLVGVKDYAYRYDMWQGVAWSNAITLTVRPAER